MTIKSPYNVPMKFVVQVYKGFAASKVSTFLTNQGITIDKELHSWGQLIDDGSFGLSDREVTMDTFFVCDVETNDLTQSLRKLKLGLYGLEYRYVPDTSKFPLGGHLSRRDPGGDIDLLKYDEFFEKPETEGGIAQNPHWVGEYDFTTTRMGRIMHANERDRYDRLQKALGQFDRILEHKISSRDLGLERSAFTSQAARWADQYFGFTGSDAEKQEGQRRYQEAIGTDNALQIALEARQSLGLQPLEGTFRSTQERM